MLLAEVERLTRELAGAKAEVQRLSALAEEDPLCAILNRRGFDREFKRSAAHVARYGTAAALLLIDLDDFKDINDASGHAAGDAVLKDVASVLSRGLRESDVVARIGGDEFAVILWHAGLDEALAIGARLTASLPSPASFGAAAFERDACSGILERADLALYAAKRRKGETNGVRR